MDLSSILPKNKKEEDSREIFWSVVLENDWIQAGVWEIVDGSVKLISEGVAVAWKEEGELIDATDTALSGAVGELEDDAPDPQKTVFGVSSTWVIDGNIKEEKLKLLKGICAKLSLTPSGFVVLPEAIAHLTKSTEGSPLSGVLIGVSEEELEVSVFKLGKLMGTQIVARSVSVSDDILEGLARFASTDPFPSRFILYDGKEGELEETKQSIIETSWQSKEKVKFLHSPKIEIFKPKDKVLATALAGAAEIANISSVAVGSETKGERKQMKVEETSNVSEPDGGVSAEDVGFVVGEDVAVSGQKVKEPFSEKSSSVEKKRSTPFVHRVRSLSDSFKDKLEDFGSGKMKIKKTASSGKKRGPMMATLLIVGVLALFSAWWFLPESTVTIFVSPKKLKEDIDLKAGPGISSFDVDAGEVPGEFISVSESGEKTKSTTGTKTIGDRAKGSVEIRNGTSSSVQLAVGTIITSGNDLEFEIINSASIEAALSTTSPGTETVEVQALNIGSEYNLAKDETFEVGNYDRVDVDAVTTGDFTGGSSRQISAVSKDDVDELLFDLEEELRDKALVKLKAQISEDDYLIEDSLTTEILSTDFSAEEGEESERVELSLEVKVRGVVVKKGHIFELSKKVLEEKIPAGYVLRENQIKFNFDVEDSDSDTYYFIGEIEANLLPEINTEDVAANIAGKTTSVAERYLSTISGYQRAQIILTPSLPGGLNTLPHVVGRISVEVAAER